MRGSSSKGNLVSNAGLQSELEALLLQQQFNRGLILQRERELDVSRSGSAPPTVEGALLSADSLFRYPNCLAKYEGGDDSASNGMLTEEEIRSHPAYLEYYYSNENLNPRLPPPLLSGEDWQVAQRVRAAGFDLGRNSVDHSGSSSSFTAQPGLSVKNVEDDLRELTKAALINPSRKHSTESLDKGSPALTEASGSGMGVRRKSFAGDMLQEGFGQPVKSNLSRPSSRSSVANVLDAMGMPNSNAIEVHNKAESFEAVLPENTHMALSSTQNIGAENHSSLRSSGTSTVSTTRTELVGTNWCPGLDRMVTIGNGVNRAGNIDSVALNAPNFSSSGIFEIADVADSLSGLQTSSGQHNTENILNSSLQMGIPTSDQQNLQQHYSGNSRSKHLADNINYMNLMRTNGSAGGLNLSKSTTNEPESSSRRTVSTSNLQSHNNPSDFATREYLKIHRQSNNLPGVDVSRLRHRGFSVDQKPDMMINNDVRAGVNRNGLVLRNCKQAGLHFPVVDPHQIQNTQKMLNHGRKSAHILGNSSQGIPCVGSRHSLEDLHYLETLLLQTHQYQSHILQKPGGISHHYPGNPSFAPCSASSQGDLVRNSQNSRVPPSSSMLHYKKSAQMLSTSRNLKGESNGLMHSHAGSSTKGRFESLLQLLKTNKTRTLELSDILGHVVEFSMDQVGSRFIQEKLESATFEEKTKIQTEIIPHARNLMIDVFGNYVIQKFFGHGTESQRKELARHLIGHVLPLTLHMYGCRVIQKALEVVDVELQTEMAAELDGSVLKCVYDQNGNHVIQKCIECVPQDRIQFMISSFLGHVVTLSTHPYGCRVIQRVLEHCGDPKTQEIIMDEILSSVCKLAQDQYGNYVIQHVVQQGKPHERSAIIRKLYGQIVKMSQQKFASNVVEKCLTFGGPEERKMLVNEMLGSADHESEPLQVMMKDPFGNYVVQKVFETCDDKSRELILSRTKLHLNELKRYTYGKHIVSSVEKLVAADERHIGQSSSTST